VEDTRPQKTQKEWPIDRHGDWVKRATERLREIQASGVALFEVLGGEAGAAFVREDCGGDSDVAEVAFALVYSPWIAGSRLLGEGEAKTGATNGFESLREKEDALLLEDGFELAGSDDLWVKERVCYGREAALQVARRRDS
jgi:hypothetical protein